jgi:1-deoxy-D-xylulose-5-phosphate synthase
MLLDKVHAPSDLKKLAVEDLPRLAAEIREVILKAVSRQGGHLASSLGAVELILALHYCLDICKDKIIFDVGHQAYAHKILTGRSKEFCSLRTYKGISGFPCREESRYDCFSTGHSSNAVSLAFGVACARDFSGEDFKVVAVIGDGSLSGGLCFEGLNNAGHMPGHPKKDMMVVLNTNEMSIAPNAGALSTYLNKLISLPIYNHFKDSLESFARTRIRKGNRLVKIAAKFEESLKGLFVPGIFFEELGFRYFGPFDGHDLPLLVKTMRNILPLKGPLLMHVVTKKGKGYAPAEKDPVTFHGVSPFDISTGKPVKKDKDSSKTYTQVFSDILVECAQKNGKIVAITAAMPEGTGLDAFRDRFPRRLYDVGIAEGHGVCFAAGLACQGLRPVFAVYSTFLQRAYDQIIEDVALQDVPVILCVDRAGIVGEDGKTHQGIFDIAYLRTVPSLVLMAPKDGQELKQMFEYALTLSAPVAIRYPRAKVPESAHKQTPLVSGRPEVLKEGADFLVIALGSMVEPAQEAVGLLEKEGLSGGVLNARFVKPLDEKYLRQLVGDVPYVFTVEEGIVNGGFGCAVSEALGRPVSVLGLPCAFITHGTRDDLLALYGLSPERIADTIRKACGRARSAIRT